MEKVELVNLTRAYMSGRDAAREGRPLTDCPFNTLGGLAERCCARAWIRGWRMTEATEDRV